MNGVAITADMRVLVSAHLKRGATFLANATTAAELLEASAAYSAAYDEAKRLNRLAAAKGAHDEVIANIHRAQAEALEGEASAKRLLADAYDAAQPKEARLGGRPKTVPDGNGFTAAEAGLSRKAIHEARIIRDAEEAHPGIVKETIEAAVAAGEEPTRAKVRRAALKSAGRKLKQRRQTARPAVEETQHDRDVRMLLGVWEAACETARAEFLSIVANQN